MMNKSKSRRSSSKRSIRAVRPAGRKSSTSRRRGASSRKSAVRKTAEFLGI